MPRHFPIYKQAQMQLSDACPRMKSLINDLPRPRRIITANLFEALCHSIIGQQISTKAATTICNRFDKLFNPLTPQHLQQIHHDTIQKCGISHRKVDYLKGIANASISREVDFATLNKLSDHQVIEKLVTLKGIGTWTAEMLLLFSLERKNVLSFGDFAIRKALRKIHHLETLTKKDFDRYAELYSPYGSTASLYLWQSLK